MNKRIVTMALTGAMIIGNMGMAYADAGSKNDPYKNNREIQEILKAYDNADENNGMLLAPNPTAEENVDIKVAKDGNIEIKLEENITTGCTWHVKIEDGDMIKVKEDEYKDIDKTEDREIICGAPGVHTWNFEALKEGKTKITFELYQDWDSETIYETKEYTITIGAEGEKQVYVNPYADNKELEEIFEMYDKADENSDLLLSPNPLAEKNTERDSDKGVAVYENNENESGLLQKVIQFFTELFSI